MICEYVELGLDSLDNRDIAKAMLRFWQYQAEQARQHCAAVRLQVEHAHAANNEAIEEWKQSDDLGFDPRLPFSDGEIARLSDRLPTLQQNLKEANAMAGYIINFITDRAHPQD